MKVIGLTGGVGSGKSLVAKLLAREYGADLLIADDLGRVVMEPGTECFAEIAARFGNGAVASDGALDRDWLAHRIFQDEQDRKALNDIIHPAVTRYIGEYIDARRQEQGLIVLESAILFEAGCDRFCDQVWYVHVSERVRRQRLAEDRGYSVEKSQSIMDKQLSEQEFLERCDLVIENDGTVQELRDALRHMMTQGGDGTECRRVSS